MIMKHNELNGAAVNVSANEDLMWMPWIKTEFMGARVIKSIGYISKQNMYEVVDMLPNDEIGWQRTS